MAQAGKSKGGKQQPAKKPNDLDKRITRPLTPEALADYGELKTPPPMRKFQPEGEWKQIWRIWMTGGAWDNYRGYLAIERKKSKEGICDLSILQALLSDRTRTIHEMKVSMRGLDDALGRPASWRLLSRIYDPKSQEEFQEAKVDQSGSLAKPKSLEITTNGHKRILPVSRRWTSNWSLFEAVQRLSREAMKPMEFDLLEDLDMLKTNHRLVRRGEEILRIGDKNIAATRFDQIGRGCLPQRYYIDGKGRLLLTHTELRAYILDAKTMDAHQKELKALVNKEMK